MTRAYASADFSEPNAAFLRHFIERFPGFGNGWIVHLGCGPGDIVLRLARHYPRCRVTGIDGAGAMPALAVEKPGAAVMVMDLARPKNAAAARAIVELYAGAEPEVLRQDFYNSLLAAFEPAEIAGQLRAAGLEALAISMVSDRHWLVSGQLPA